MEDLKKLNKKQMRFCEEYVIDLNGTHAAIRAGNSEKTAQEQASRLLCNVMVQDYIKILQEDIAERNKIKADDVVRDIIEVKNRCMQKKPVMIFDKVEKEYVQKEEYVVVDQETGKEELLGVWDFDSQGALKALDMLSKHTGVYKEDNDQKAPKNVIVTGEVADKVLDKIKEL